MYWEFGLAACRSPKVAELAMEDLKTWQLKRGLTNAPFLLKELSQVESWNLVLSLFDSHAQPGCVEPAILCWKLVPRRWGTIVVSTWCSLKPRHDHTVLTFRCAVFPAVGRENEGAVLSAAGLRPRVIGLLGPSRIEDNRGLGNGLVQKKGLATDGLEARSAPRFE